MGVASGDGGSGGALVRMSLSGGSFVSVRVGECQDRIPFQHAGPFIPGDLTFGDRFSTVEVFDIDSVVFFGGVYDPVAHSDGYPAVATLTLDLLEMSDIGVFLPPNLELASLPDRQPIELELSFEERQSQRDQQREQ